jgi:hypothetical protein
VVEFKESTFIDFLYAKDYEDLTDDMVRVISFKPRTTKAGRKMARCGRGGCEQGVEVGA